MKKRMKLLISIIMMALILIPSLGAIMFRRKLVEKDSPMQHLGTKQIMKNEGSSPKNIQIKVEGYYDITTTKSKNTDSSQLPELNSSRLAQFFNQDEAIRLDSGQEATLTPAKFEKIPLKNKIYSLTDTGNYLIGQQFPSGEYWISYTGDIPEWKVENGMRSKGAIQVVVHSPKAVTDSKSYTLTPKDTKQKVTLTDRKFLTPNCKMKLATSGKKFSH
ncbi:MAG: hypothetical protein L0I48_09045, partial [Lactococcus plantarum]|nr:hypothetical protein [Lactococcus plantarum]MDN6071323.1 hypothetical protein [Lactococcus plantarum]